MIDKYAMMCFFGVDMGAERQSAQDDTVDYVWNIDNKYYTSQVTVRATEKLPVKFPTEGVAAFIVYHDPQAVRETSTIEERYRYVGMFAGQN